MRVTIANCLGQFTFRFRLVGWLNNLLFDLTTKYNTQIKCKQRVNLRAFFSLEFLIFFFFRSFDRLFVFHF